MKYRMRYLTGIDELSVVAELGNRAFSSYSSYSLAQRLAFYTKWFKKNNKCFSILLDANDAAIGYFCALPMVEKKSNSHYKGEVSQFEMDTSLITAPGMETNNVYTQGMYIKKGYRNPAAFRCLLHGSIKMANAFLDPAKHAFFYAEQFSSFGQDVMEKLGFKKEDRKSHDDYSFYSKNGVLSI